MIIRGIVENGGITFGRESREVMVRVFIEESLGAEPEDLSPSRLRGRSVVMVLGDSPVQLPAAVTPADGDDAHTVEHGDDALPVEEQMNG